MIGCGDTVYSKGHVYLTIDYLDGAQEKIDFPNVVLRTGKIALASALAGQANDPYDYYIDKMLFGTNGTSSGTPKYVEETRTGLFGATLLSKNVIASVDSAAPTSTILTAVVTFSEGNGSTINEMALRMANEDLYSMATFPGIGKTSNMQLVFNWVVSYL